MCIKCSKLILFYNKKKVTETNVIDENVDILAGPYSAAMTLFI